MTDDRQTDDDHDTKKCAAIGGIACSAPNNESGTDMRTRADTCGVAEAGKSRKLIWQVAERSKADVAGRAIHCSRSTERNGPPWSEGSIHLNAALRWCAWSSQDLKVVLAAVNVGAGDAWTDSVKKSVFRILLIIILNFILSFIDSGK